MRAAAMEAMASRTYDGGGRKGSRIIARIVALLALAAVAVGIVVVVSHSTGTSSPATTAAKHQKAKPAHAAKPADDCYTVAPGDSLAAIAANERPLGKRQIAQRNNMNVGATLQPGQQLNITPDGCK
jgi:LysM repeat protein